MADQTEIIGTIVLNGIDDIIANLQKMGLAGTEAFDSLTKAAAQLSGQDIGDNIGKAGAQASAAEVSIGKLGETGKAAFEGMAIGAERLVAALNGLSASAALGAFEGLAGTAERVTGSMGTLGASLSVVVGSLAAGAAAVGGITLGLFEFAKSSAEATSAAGGLARSMGTTLDVMGGVTTAFAEAGVSTENFGNQMRILGVRVAAAGPEIQKSLEEAGDKIEENQLKIADAAATVEDGQLHTQQAFIKTAEAANTVTAAQQKLAQSDDAIKTAQLNLVDAQDKVKFAYLGRQQAALSLEQAEYNLRLAQGGERDPEEERQLKVKEAELAVAEAKRKQADAAKEAERAAIAERTAQVALSNALADQEKDMLALQKAQIDLDLARSAQGTEESKREQEQLNLQAAQRKAAQDNRNDAKQVADAIFDTGGAFKEMGAQIDVTRLSAEQLFRGIEERAGELKAAQLGKEGFVQPTQVEVLRQIAEAFKTITNEAQKQAILRAAFGRSYSEGEIAALSKGAAGWDAIQRAEEKAGFTLNTVAVSSHNFLVALDTLTNHLDVLRQQMGAPFEDIFATELTKLNAFIVDNRSKIVEWADTMANRLKPVIEDVFKLIEGKEIDKDSFVGKLAEGINVVIGVLGDLKTVILDVWGVIKPFIVAANAIAQALGGWQVVIEAIIAYKLASWLTELLAPLGNLGTAFKLAAGGAEALAAVDIAAWALRALGPLGAVAAALGIVAAKAGEVLIAQGKTPFVASYPGQDVTQLTGPQAAANRQQALADLEKQKQIAAGGPTGADKEKLAQDKKAKEDELAAIKQALAQRAEAGTPEDAGSAALRQRAKDLEEDLGKTQKSLDALGEAADAASGAGKAGGDSGLTGVGKEALPAAEGLRETAKQTDVLQDIVKNAVDQLNNFVDGLKTAAENLAKLAAIKADQAKSGTFIGASGESYSRGTATDEKLREAGYTPEALKRIDAAAAARGDTSVNLSTAGRTRGGRLIDVTRAREGEEAALKDAGSVSLPGGSRIISSPGYREQLADESAKRGLGKQLADEDAAKAKSGAEAAGDALKEAMSSAGEGFKATVTEAGEAFAAAIKSLGTPGPKPGPTTPAGPFLTAPGTVPVTPTEVPALKGVIPPARDITAPEAIPPSAPSPPTVPSVPIAPQFQPGPENVGQAGPIGGAADKAAGALDSLASAAGSLLSKLSPISPAQAAEGGTGAPGGSEVFSPTGWTPPPAPTGPQETAPQGGASDEKLAAAGEKLTSAGDTLTTAGNDLSTAVSSLSDAATTLGNAASSLADAASRMSAPGKARGGIVHGPGTGTSDNVPIMASHGEFVVQAEAVRKLGVHAMHAINQGTLPRFFSAGGLVDFFANLPGFAGGGAVEHFTRSFAGKAGSYAPAGGSGGARSLTLVIEGKQFPGLTGSANTMGDLERHATSSRIARIARNNPSWHK